MSVLNDSCVESLIPENNYFSPKCDTHSIGTQTRKKVQEKKEHNIKMLPKEQVYSDHKHYHLNYDTHTSNVTSLHLFEIREKGQHK